jgi:hypothetical protein
MEHTLVSPSYFTEVVQHAQKLGLVLVAQVAIDTNDYKYHVPVSYARDTRLFFHKPGFNLFILLSFSEKFNTTGDQHSYWHIRADVEQDARESIDKEDWRDWKPECVGFHHAGWSSVCAVQQTWNLDQTGSYGAENHLTPAELATSVSSLLQSLGDNLAQQPFKELQVTSWEPDYCFKGCGETFWNRFRDSSEALHGNRRQFWKLVDRPWGSDGLKR